MKLKYKISILNSLILIILLFVSAVVIITKVENDNETKLDTIIKNIYYKEIERLISNTENKIHDVNTLKFYIEEIYRWNFTEEEKRKNIEDILTRISKNYIEKDGTYTIWFMKRIDPEIDKQFVDNYGNENGTFNVLYDIKIDKIIYKPDDEYKETYYTSPFKSRKIFITDPYQYEISSEEKIIMVSICVPIFSNGEVIGVAGIDIDSNIVYSKYNHTDNKSFEGYTFLLNNNQKFINHPKTAIIGKSISEVDPEYDKKYNVALNISKGNKVFFTKKSTLDGSISYTYLIPFEYINGYYTVGISVPEKYIKGTFFGIINNLIIIFIVITITSCLFLIIFTSIYMKKIQIISDKLKEVSEIKEDSYVDLDLELDEDGNDEISEISKSFNDFMKYLKNTIKIIINTTKESFKISNNLTSLSKESENILNELKETITNIKYFSENSVAGANETITSVMNIKKSLENVYHKIGEQNNNIISTTTAFNQISASTSNLFNMFGNVKKSFEELNKNLLENKKNVNMMRGFVSDINKKFDSVLEASKMITDIAVRTNILSMNAAIEAAHAGTSGKGFSVIAQETKNLSEKTRSKSDEISTDIKELARSINNFHKSFEILENTFSHITSLSEKMIELYEEIECSTKESKEMNNNVISYMEQLKSFNSSIVNIFEESNVNSTQIYSEMNEIIERSSKLNKDIEKVEQEILNKLLKNENKISSDIMENYNEVDKLIEITRRFKIN